MDTPIRFTLPADSNVRLNNLCGVMDNNILHLERALSVTIKRRGEVFEINGDDSNLAKTIIEHFFTKADKNIDINDIRRYLTQTVINNTDTNEIQETYQKEPKHQSEYGFEHIPGNDSLSTKTNQSRHFKVRTHAQQVFIDKINANAITLCTGPAGTGKTHVAIAAALQQTHINRHLRLLLSRPIVEAAGERLGFLPGDMEKKANPYLRPLYDVLAQTIGLREVERRMAEGLIEVLPLAFMRGITLKNTFLILDEAQNTTKEQMKMLLSRIGENSTIVVCGDPTQNDLTKDMTSGLCDAITRLQRIKNIAVHHFDAGDIVRHPLVHKILTAYEKS